jgi:hypothetical protein
MPQHGKRDELRAEPFRLAQNPPTQKGAQRMRIRM